MSVPVYTDAFRAQIVRKLLLPNAGSARRLAREIGVGQATLSRWLLQARSVGVMDKPAKNWTPAEKFRVVVEASRLTDDELGEFLRREGLHQAQLTEWRAAAEGGLVDAPKASARSAEAKRIKELEWEIRRKDKALAEAAALLILKKKAEAIWGDMGDDTTDKNEP